MLVLIGSRALEDHVRIERSKSIRDIDVIGTYDEVMDSVKHYPIRECYPIKSGKKYVIKYDEHIVEAEIAWPGSLAEQFIELVKADPDTRKGHYLMPSLDVLYMLKMSHRYLKNSPHFLKTMRDIQLMRSLGAKIRPEHQAFFKARQKETYDYGHPKLNVSKKSFFNGDGVQYHHDHDTIHLAMAQLNKPAYKFYQPDNSEVNTSKETFFVQPEQIKLFGVLEESYVLALERAIIPFGDKTTPKKAFDIALMKVCTSITSGWFREYSWEHYDEVQALYNDDYVNRFWKAVESGIVKPYHQ